ncbi:MAG TPA: hypothetical protein VGN97_19955 [Mesorhizobium sp.]|jgi:hypothetical protein|nr:hypothetical protein [Mesorhizobium sp.]
MSKLLLALGLVAALSAPAAAGRLDIDPSLLNNPSQLEEVPAAETGLTADRSVQAPDDADGRSAGVEAPYSHGTLFGPNSR